MKSVVVTLVVLAVFAMVGNVMAAEAGGVDKAATKAVIEPVTLTGTVSVTKDANSVVTGVELKTADGADYQVALSGEGKALEKENGKKVEVTGIVSERGGKKMLHVKSSKLVEEVPAK